jgi:hypothetical protein
MTEIGQSQLSWNCDLIVIASHGEGRWATNKEKAPRRSQGGAKTKLVVCKESGMPPHTGSDFPDSFERSAAAKTS